MKAKQICTSPKLQKKKRERDAVKQRGQATCILREKCESEKKEHRKEEGAIAICKLYRLFMERDR